MTRPVTVGVDGSPASLAAARWGAREAVRRAAPLRLVRAWEQRHFSYAPLAGVDPQQLLPGNVPQDLARELRGIHPDLDIDTEQITGSPADVLRTAAEGSELLVIGSQGMGPVAGFLVGSVALATVAHVRQPVVLVRAGTRAEDEHTPAADDGPSTATPYRPVVLGLDATAPSSDLLSFAFHAAADRATPLSIVYGWSMPAPYEYGGDPKLRAEVMAEETETLAAALRPWRDKHPGTEVVEQPLIGQPIHHLVEAAKNACLVVVGRRTNPSRAGTHIGHVTHGVMHHCPAPVAVVPHR